jgi:hypothetical protein
MEPKGSEFSSTKEKEKDVRTNNILAAKGISSKFPLIV